MTYASLLSHKQRHLKKPSSIDHHQSEHVQTDLASETNDQSKLGYHILNTSPSHESKSSSIFKIFKIHQKSGVENPPNNSSAAIEDVTKDILLDSIRTNYPIGVGANETIDVNGVVKDLSGSHLPETVLTAHTQEITDANVIKKNSTWSHLESIDTNGTVKDSSGPDSAIAVTAHTHTDENLTKDSMWSQLSKGTTVQNIEMNNIVTHFTTSNLPQTILVTPQQIADANNILSKDLNAVHLPNDLTAEEAIDANVTKDSTWSQLSKGTTVQKGMEMHNIVTHFTKSKLPKTILVTPQRIADANNRSKDSNAVHLTNDLTAEEVIDVDHNYSVPKDAEGVVSTHAESFVPTLALRSVLTHDRFSYTHIYLPVPTYTGMFRSLKILEVSDIIKDSNTLQLPRESTIQGSMNVDHNYNSVPTNVVKDITKDSNMTYLPKDLTAQEIIDHDHTYNLDPRDIKYSNTPQLPKRLTAEEIVKCDHTYCSRSKQIVSTSTVTADTVSKHVPSSISSHADSSVSTCAVKTTKTQSRFRCRICGTHFKTAVKLQFHKHLHNNDLMKCGKCSRFFINSDELFRHYTFKHFKKSPEILTCEKCHLRFDSLKSLHQHKQVTHRHYRLKHFKKSPEILTCEKCHLRFDSLKSLHQHKQVTHKPDMYLCDICKDVFKSVRNLKLHLIMKHKVKEEKHYPPIDDNDIETCLRNSRTCTECGKVFSHRFNLKQHIRFSFCGKKKRKNEEAGSYFKCRECGKKFQRKTQLKRHIVFSHLMDSYSESRFLICECCDQIFPSLKHLKKHVCKRMEHKKHVCGTCCMRFYSQYAHKRHEFKRHKEKALVCDICRKCYKSKASIERHVLSHMPVASSEENITSSKGSKSKNGTTSEASKSDIETISGKKSKFKEGTGSEAIKCEEEATSGEHSKCEEATRSEVGHKDGKESDFEDRTRNGAPNNANETTSGNESMFKEGSRGEVVHIDEKGSKFEEAARSEVEYTVEKESEFQEAASSHVPNSVCFECGKTFLHRETFNQHKLYMHSQDSQWCCEHCGNLYKTFALLKTHKLRHNLGSKYECKRCGMLLSGSNGLRTHMLVHNEPLEVRQKRYKILMQKRIVQRKAAAARKLIEHRARDGINRDSAGTEPNVNMAESAVDSNSLENVAVEEFEMNLLTDQAKMKPKRGGRRMSSWCKVCEWKLRRKELQNHRLYHMMNGYKCKKCGKVLKQVVCWTQHMKIHTVPMEIRRERHHKSYPRKKKLRLERMHRKACP